MKPFRLVFAIVIAACTGLLTLAAAGPAHAASAAVPHAIEQALKQDNGIGPNVPRALAAEIQAFYASRNFEPLWLGPAGPSRQMAALRRIMDKADSFGLEPSVYATPEPGSGSAPETHALADVAFSRAATLFVTHLASGRIDPAEIGAIITLKPERPDPAAVLARLSRTAGMALAVSRYEPTHPQYHALKARLAALRSAGAEPPRIVLPAGGALKPGAADGRVPLLRARLGIAASADETYDPPLVDAITAFQAAEGLTADGILGARTRKALNGASRAEEVAAVLVNMERWRWMPRDLGAFHVFVNIPEFVVRVVADGKELHQTRVVVGTPDHATPTFSHVIDHLVVNPYWNVPTSIVGNEMLPEIQRDPGRYFASRGYQVLAKAGGKMRVVDPDSIDWWMINPRSFRIRQAPGDQNALGRIKFMFPNQHSVYLHDTPSKALFKKDVRTFSHGCVRVDDPLAFADAVLSFAAPEWNAARLEKLYGGPERRVDLDRPVPVHLSYFTLTINPAGQARHFDDVYGYDAQIVRRLGPQG